MNARTGRGAQPATSPCGQRLRLVSVVALTALLIGTVVSASAATAGPLPMIVHRGIVDPVRLPSGGVLYSQNDRDAGSGVSSQSALGDQAADDFKVPSGAVWRIRKVIATGVYFNGCCADSENVLFYRDSGGLPGTLKIQADGVAGVDNDGSFDIPIPGTKLKGGADGAVFWVSIQVNMDFDLGQWYWETRKVQKGNPAVWQNPQGTSCQTWQPLHQCWGDVGPDLMFALSGKQR